MGGRGKEQNGGLITGHLWQLTFTNSHGNKGSFAGGKCYHLGPFIFAVGKIYGYESHPRGRWMVGGAYINKKEASMKLVVPGPAELILINAKYEELKIPNALHK